MRVAESRKIRVNVAGTDKCGLVDCAGYVLVHEQDLAALVRAAKEK